MRFVSSEGRKFLQLLKFWVENITEIRLWPHTRPDRSHGSPSRFWKYGLVHKHVAFGLGERSVWWAVKPGSYSQAEAPDNMIIERGNGHEAGINRFTLHS